MQYKSMNRQPRATTQREREDRSEINRLIKGIMIGRGDIPREQVMFRKFNGTNPNEFCFQIFNASGLSNRPACRVAGSVRTNGRDTNGNVKYHIALDKQYRRNS